MPNWCSNTLTLFHEDPEMMERVRKGAETGLFNEFIPMPEALKRTLSPNSEGKSLVLKYGHTNWHDFANNKWGTKWDVDHIECHENGSYLELMFDTAWSPPIAFYDALVRLGFEVSATYREEGMAFKGSYEDGVDSTEDITQEEMDELYGEE